MYALVAFNSSSDMVGMEKLRGLGRFRKRGAVLTINLYSFE